MTVYGFRSSGIESTIRCSRTVSRFWHSAYPDLTVDQVERNYRIALKLRTKGVMMLQF